ncbi:MAG: hypothetical protein ACLPXB_10540 [Thiobacillaceae bacterium]
MKASEKQATEFDLLRLFVEQLEREGLDRKQGLFAIDESVIAQLAVAGFSITVAQAQQLAGRCLANEWLEHEMLGGKYVGLSLTASGLGIVRSRRLRQQQLESRTWLKRVSDYIEEHKGLFIALGAVLGLAGLVAKLFSNGHGT